MRLLQKTTRAYLTLSTMILIVAGGVLYFTMTTLLEHEFSERMNLEIERIGTRIRLGEQIPSFPPDLEVVQLSSWYPDTIIVKNETRFDEIEQEEETFKSVTAFVTSGDKTFRVTIQQIMPEKLDYLNSIGLTLVIVLALMLLSLVLINRRISKRLWRPFNHNLALLKKFSLDDNQALVLERTDTAEFEDLNSVVEKLIDRIREDYFALKVFTENAAHEFQTPLTIIQTKLESVLQSPALTETQATSIEAGLEAVTRLSRLNKALLLLTRIENDQFRLANGNDVAEMLKNQLHRMRDFISSAKLNVSLKLDAHPIIFGNAVLIDILLGNLLRNGIKHNIDGGELQITMQSDRLILANTGKPLSVNADVMFERFRKSNPASSSPGLGLAIARKICDTHGWKISYTNDGEWHRVTCFF